MAAPCFTQEPGAPTGAAWEVLREADFSTVGAADLRAGGTVAAGGVTWSTVNGNKCSSVFGPDGSTGFRIQQTAIGVVSSEARLDHDLKKIQSMEGISTHQSS